MPTTIADVRKKAAKQLGKNISDRSAKLTAVGQHTLTNFKYEVAPGDVSSADYFKRTADTLIDELNIQHTALDIIEEQYSTWKERRMLQLQAIGQRIEDLEVNLQGLLMSIEETDGFYQTFTDKLDNGEYVDVGLTTATVLEGSVVAGVGNMLPVDTGNVDLTWKVLAGNNTPIGTLEDTDFILDSDPQSYAIGSFTLPVSTDKCTVELTLSFPDGFSDINMLQLLTGTNSSSTKYFVTAIYTLDGQIWDEICSEKVCYGSIMVNTGKIKPKMIKIFINNRMPVENNGNFLYQFYIKEVRLFRAGYTPASSLYTKELSVKDSDDADTTFSVFALTTDETLNDQTLTCYVSFGNGNDFTDFAVITPTNRGGQPVDVDQTSITDSSTITLDNNDYFPYYYDMNRLTSLNVDGTYLPNSIKVIRFLNEWYTLNATHTCYTYIDAPTTLDFQDKYMLVDDAYVQGTTSLAAGIHSISVSDTTTKTFVESLLSDAGLIFGAYIADIVGLSSFLNADSDDYTVMAFTDKKSTADGPYNSQGLMVKADLESMDESMLAIYKTVNTSNIAQKFKLRFDFANNATQTAVLERYTAKVNTI